MTHDHLVPIQFSYLLDKNYQDTKLILPPDNTPKITGSLPPQILISIIQHKLKSILSPSFPLMSP